MDKINEVKTKRDLANFLGIKYRTLTYILYVVNIDDYYDSFEIPKKSGGNRCINAPKDILKVIQKKLANALYKYQKELIIDNFVNAKVSHAFEKGKSIKTNAYVHRKKRYVINLDLENYFESFHFGRVRGFFEKNENFNFSIEVATVIAQLTCYKGYLPQGAPTSPIITNLICNILDMRLIKIAKKYRLDYTRYADDMTFSTDEKKFIKNIDIFLKEINKEIEKAGFKINSNKTRLSYANSRQEVTGLTVNDKVNVNRKFYKETRAMADSLYKNGEFKIDGCEATINQLEGRFSFIDQVDKYNNKKDIGIKHNFRNLSAHEKQYQYFLFYKYFLKNSKPLIVTEGKTDVLYLKAALKKNYERYPDLIIKTEERFEFKIAFFKKTDRMKYFFGLPQDGADAMKNIYNLYKGINYYSLYDYFIKKYSLAMNNPVILIFDNEQRSKRPLKSFIDHIHEKNLVQTRYKQIIGNLFVLTNPLVRDKEECEIEDLFDDSVLSHKISGKSFSKDDKYDKEKFYGKNKFSEYVLHNYEKIDFKEFIPFLDDLNKIILEYKDNSQIDK